MSVNTNHVYLLKSVTEDYNVTIAAYGSLAAALTAKAEYNAKYPEAGCEVEQITFYKGDETWV